MPGGAGVRRPDHQTTTRPTAGPAADGGPEDGLPESRGTLPDAAGGLPGTGAGAAAPPRPTDPDGVTAEAVLAPYLRGQAADFLRSLRLHREHSAPSDAGGQGAEAASRALRRSARRISGSLHTFRSALDPVWADHLRTELAWLSGTLAREHAYAGRLTRLVDALHQLSGAALPAARGTEPTGSTRPAAGSPGKTPSASSEAQGRAVLGVGAARAGALLERQLTLARTRAHSAALQALGSSRFHAVADAVALLASEVPLAPGTTGRGTEALLEPAERAEQRLIGAVAALPPDESAEPYNEAQDAPWHQARLLLRLHRYAHEVVLGAADPVLTGAGHALDLHRDAAEAAGAAAAAARTPRIAPATAYALGVLHADQRHEVEAARAVFRETWPYAAAMTAP
ncbi:CHAD domain-containing protein [Streptomyces microflavus]|uniref:CHAD domain-containing protein n=1 Tax=Streptomyces microflavus TaxID=1919 RepID=A0A7J0CTB5_STRMI|nr:MULTISPECIES: CHAD domain-containing protein [Streptomyces]MDX2980940.1 CHAD domain-containing protein [Streptomyces sp. NRRL_B-2249]GFN05713.1 CHAD domain-containing protein [Streptomyces microflavus]GGX72658.1 CHAD domain-containing protein [Streptomyces microflavus]